MERDVFSEDHGNFTLPDTSQDDAAINASLDPARNRGAVPATVFDHPETAPDKEHSDHPELWTQPYAWHPREGHRPEHPNDPFPPSQEGPARGNLLRLGRKLTDRALNPMTRREPEYWGLDKIATDSMIAIANHMQVRVPYTMEEIAALVHKPVAEVEDDVNQMAQTGILEYNWENEDRHKQFVLPVLLPGMGEFYAMNEALAEKQPQMNTFFERVAYLGPEFVHAMVPMGGAGLGMHVIPVEKAIEHENVTADVEHISHWLDKYDRFAAGTCSCRQSETVRGVNSGDDPEGWCIGVGDMADYEAQTGKGRYITKEQALAIIQKAEDNGFVHQITNIDGSGKIFAICNCNKSMCYGLRTSQLFNTPNFSRSAYVAHTDASKCVACGMCVEACPAGAVRLGQRLCTTHGPVRYPKRELPDEAKWGPERWDYDYRDNNRIETYDTGTAPCKVACPAHIAIEGYLRLAAQGRYREALALIKKENPFPATCGRICNHRCEDVCTRAQLDQALAIEAVKKFIAEKDLEAEHRFVPPVVQPSLRGPYVNKIAIIGAGPAGLTCAYYLAAMGYSPTVFERQALPGGMMTYGIPSYKLEKDVVAAEIDVLRELGVDIRCGVDVGHDVTLDQLRDQGYQAFYLAIGAQGARRAGIPGEDGPGVTYAVDLLREVLADETYPLPGTTVVVGGGNVAVDAARAAVRAGSGGVSMWSLEQRNEMPATPEELVEAEDDGVTVSCGWGPARVERDETGHVTGITFKRCTRVFDESGRFSPAYDETDTVLVPCDNVVFSIGQTIKWGSLLDGSTVELAGGRAVADPVTYQTAQPDVFVGGDDLTGPRFVIDAIAAGHEAAVSIHRFVQPGNSLTVGRNRRQYVSLNKDELDLRGYDTAPRQEAGVDAHVNKHGYRDWHRTLTEEQVKAECARCLKCGASVVDPNRCVGCGVCTTKCSFDAIHLFREHPEASVMDRNQDKMKKIIPYALKREVKIVRKKRAGGPAEEELSQTLEEQSRSVE